MTHIIRPSIGVSAVEPKRVAIVAIDINPRGRARSEIAVWIRVVRDERHDYPAVS